MSAPDPELDSYRAQLADEIAMENTYRSRIKQPSVCVYCRHSLVECHDETGCHWRQEGAVRGCGCKLPVTQGVARLEQAATSGDGSESADWKFRFEELSAEFAILSRACGNWRTWPNEAESDHDHPDWKVAAKAILTLRSESAGLRCDVYTELCKPQTDIKFRLECVHELGHKGQHAYEFPTWPSNLEHAPVISRPPSPSMDKI